MRCARLIERPRRAGEQVGPNRLVETRLDDEEARALDAGHGGGFGATRLGHTKLGAFKLWRKCRPSLIAAAAGGNPAAGEPTVRRRPDSYGRPPVCRSASVSAMVAATATFSERRGARMGMRRRASAAACTASGAPADSRPTTTISPR